MRTIYKYALPFGDEVSVQMPKDASILKFGIQSVIDSKPEIVVWSIVDTEAEMEERRFRIVGTGHPLEDNTIGHVLEDYTTAHGSYEWVYEYFDTLFDRRFVWHIFVGYKQ